MPLFFRIYQFVDGILLGFVSFFVRNATLIFVSLKSCVIFFVSFPQYVKVANAEGQQFPHQQLLTPDEDHIGRNVAKICKTTDL